VTAAEGAGPPSARVERVDARAAALAVRGVLEDPDSELERGSLVAERRRDDAQAIVPAAVRDGRFEAELDLVLLLGAHRRTDVWDLYFQAGPGAPRLRLAARETVGDAGPIRVGAGISRREIETYATARGNLSVRSRRAADAPTPPARRTSKGSVKRRVARVLNRLGLRAARVVAGGPRGGTERPRVVFVLMSAWGMGGTIRTTLNVAGHLAGRYDVTVLSVVRLRGRAFLEVPRGVELVAVDDRRSQARGALERLLRRAPSILMPRIDRAHRAWSLWTDARLVGELRRLRPDVIVGTRPGLNIVVAGLRSARRLAVGVEHLNVAVHQPAMRRDLGRRLRDLDALVVLTDTDRPDARALVGEGVRVVAIPNAAPPVRPEPAELEAPVVVGAGRLSYQKGFGRLLRAFAPVAAAHPEWRLRIFGEGQKRPHLEALAAELGIADRVALPGRVRDLRAELERASIFALSSRFEGFPMVLLEAMSQGLAIVSFDCRTGPRELLEDGRDGVLVPDGDVAALSRALLELVEDRERRRRLGAAARERARELSLGAVGARWDGLLDELLTARSPRERSVLTGAGARVSSGHDHGNG
jgi:glycosyltransferase involved in cell wall biosynthesis